jgi:hypothetical protein
VARPGSPRERVVKQMEHQTGPDGTGEADAAPAATTGRLQVEPDRVFGAVRDAAADSADDPITGADRDGPAPATGEPRVDAALRLLERLPGLPVSEHSQLFEQVHAQLSDVLGELDSGPAGSASALGG